MTLEERVARLESLVSEGHLHRAALPQKRLPLLLLLVVVSAALCFRGLGLPNHPYQVALGILTIALAYHRRWLALPSRHVEWLLALGNAFCVAMLFKLIIGSGIRHPFWWARYPELTMERAGTSWLDVVPNLKVIWQSMPLASWEIDLTLMQTFLLIVTLIGALFRFQPFVSLTAFLLILVSLPAFADFNWPWVFPGMMASAITLYVQRPGTRAREWSSR